MTLSKFDQALKAEIEDLKAEGRAKITERIIHDYIPASENKGPRYKIEGSDLEFIRMNSNSYLDLSQHPKMKEAADVSTHKFGVGPGAVRFIDGTFRPHIDLENSVAKFVNKPAAKIFNSAYTSNLATALTLAGPSTFWIGDALNHNSIIRSMRIANVPSKNRTFFEHNNMEALEEKLQNIPTDAGFKRVIIVFDGIFSMRGDFAPMQEMIALAKKYSDRFDEGVLTFMDDSHGIGAFGATGRGTMEHTNTQPDIIVGTFGKAFGVNGGFIAGSEMLIETVRQKADTYIYTNPLSTADCAAAQASIDIVDSQEGLDRLTHLHKLIAKFRKGIAELGLETIEGPHPVVPIVVRDTEKTHKIVKRLFDKGILVVGLTFPVVPKGDETIRTQINAGLTDADLDYVLESLKEAIQ